jgi:hypothetical protein
MRSFFQNKKLTLLLAVLGLGALVVLSLGLRDIRFNPAQPIGRAEAETSAPSAGLGEVFEDASLRSQFLVWGAAILLIFLISLLLSPEGRKYLLRLVIRVFSTYWLIYFLMRNYGDRLSSLANLNLSGLVLGQPGEAGSDVPPPVFIPPQESSWLTYVVSLLFIVFVIFVGWRVWVFVRQFSLPTSNEKPLEELAKIARSSLHDLSQGGDTSDVIMKCYFRMSSVVSDKRMLHRKDSMTPSEFATRLVQAGLPGDAVQRLTRLFEAVRYGGYRSGQKDINEAVACLTSILNYCGEPV